MSNRISLNDLATEIVNNKSLVTQADISNIPIIPSQTSNDGKFLTTDGTSMSWGVVDTDILPSLTSNSGKYLTTDGSSLNWGIVNTDILPSQTSNEGKFLKTDGTNLTWDIATTVYTNIDPNDLTDDAARDKITYGDRRYNWFIEDHFFPYYQNLHIAKCFNGVRGGASADSGSTPGDGWAPWVINNGGFFTMAPTNSIYYKFRGLYWIENTATKLPSPGILNMQDARFAAFGFKDNKWYWLGTCSMNNTDVDTYNDTDSIIPTVSITEESALSYGNSGGYPKKWQWSHNIDFYEKYRIKHVKLGTIATSNQQSFQNCDNIPEIEFF